MTKISQLADIGANLAANDEFVIRDVSDASTPNKKVTASGFFNVATALGFTGLDLITAGTSGEARVQVFASGISGRTDTTISGVVAARTTISGYFENASATATGILFPVVTQTDIGNQPNQLSLNAMLGTMAFQDTVSGIVNASGVTIAAATTDGYLRMPSGTSGIQFNGDTAAANALDDYEEGTWTVNLFDASSAGNQSATSTTGSYTKIGNTVRCTFSVNNIDTTGLTAGNLLFYSLPFIAAATYEHTGSCVISSIDLAAGYTSLAPFIAANGARGYFLASGDNIGLANALVSWFVDDAADLRVTIVYQASA